PCQTINHSGHKFSGPPPAEPNLPRPRRLFLLPGSTAFDPPGGPLGYRIGGRERPASPGSSPARSEDRGDHGFFTPPAALHNAPRDAASALPDGLEQDDRRGCRNVQ